MFHIMKAVWWVGMILIGLILAGGIAAAQTGSTTPPPSTTTTSNTGAFDKLSPGNQKIAQALFDAMQASQPPASGTATSSTPASGTVEPLTLDDIAAMKLDGKGWGKIFHELKKMGLVQEKNLGQVVSRASRQARMGAPASATVTTRSGRSQVVGNQGRRGFSSKSGRSHEPGELKIQGAQAQKLDAEAINDILATPGAGVREVKIEGVTVDPTQIDLTKISPALREVKIEGRTAGGVPFEIKREPGEVKFEGVNLSSEQIQNILSQPGVREVKIERVKVDPNQLKLQDLPPGVREVKIEGVTPNGTPFEVKVENGVVRREFGATRSRIEAGRVRVRGATLKDVEQTLFTQEGDLARGDAPFEARFRDLSLTKADQEQLLTDLQKLNQLPAGSRVRLEGMIDNRPFRAEVRNHRGDLEVKLRGVRFTSRDDARAFMNSLQQGGADRVRVRGLVDGQRFDTRFRTENGRVEQRFRLKDSDRGTVITSGSGRSQVTGTAARSGSSHGRKFGDDHHRHKEFGDLGRSSSGFSGRDISSGSGRDSGSGRSGSGRSGKD